MKYYLRSSEPLPGGAILPPKGKTVKFEENDDGEWVSEPVDKETAQAVNGCGPYSSFHEDDGALPQQVDDPSAPVDKPVANTDAAGKPADTNLPGGDPGGVIMAQAVAGEKARIEATEKADKEQEAKDAAKDAEDDKREELGLGPKPEAPEQVPDGKGGTLTINEPEKPAEDGKLKVEGESTHETETAGSADLERQQVESGAKTDNATTGVVGYADAGIPTDAERAKGETPEQPPSPTVASATPKNPLPAYTIDEVKTPDQSKQSPKSETGKATGDVAKKIAASAAAKPAKDGAENKASNG